ncbi:MAG: DHH family phosphoesterase, partial [Candidatus Saliniplasma sp.]
MEIKRDIPTLFLSHQNADPDAIGSLYFLKNRIGGDIALPDQPDSTGKRLIKFLDMDYILNPNLSDYEQIFVIDTPDPEQLKPIELSDSDNLIVIDHHQTNHWDEDIIYERRTSCAEIVYEIISPQELTEKEAIGLMAGMITDTSHFKRADALTFRTASEVLEKGNINLLQVSKIIKENRRFSEKICRLKGVRRNKYLEINGYLIAYTNVSSYESSVSNLLLVAGADISFTASQRDEKFLISGRAKEDITLSGIDIGRIFKEIGESKDNISGGGHEGAAVLKGIGDGEALLQE